MTNLRRQDSPLTEARHGLLLEVEVRLSAPNLASVGLTARLSSLLAFKMLTHEQGYPELK